MKNIHILPTDKPSRLFFNRLHNELEFTSPIPMGNNGSGSWVELKNIYITSDEEIKDVRPHKGKWQLETGQILNKFPSYLTDLSECKLVIMTTDQDLIKDGVQAIDDEFLEWIVKNPSCEEVEVEKAPYDGTKSIDKYWGGEYKIIIPRTTQQVIDEDFEGGLTMGQVIPNLEIWKDIPDYNGLYQVSDLGNIRSLNYGKIKELKPRLVGYDGNQYLAVNLSKESKVKSVKVHKLVALCFLNHTSKGYNGLVIDHIDSNKLNNRLDNLKLVTPRFNASKDKQGSSSKFTGVTWHKKSKKWQCQIYNNGKLNHLGLFNTEIEASKTYNNYLKNMTKEEPKQKCKDCSTSLEDCTCIEDTIDMKQETTLEEAAEKTLGMFYGYSFLKDTVKQLKEKRMELKISLNKMSNDLYGNRYYVNYLSKIEKGEIPNVSFEVIARMTIYLEQFKK
jgi:hypothetical protein